jgi:hypothetical protein
MLDYAANAKIVERRISKSEVSRIAGLLDEQVQRRRLRETWRASDDARQHAARIGVTLGDSETWVDGARRSALRRLCRPADAPGGRRQCARALRTGRGARGRPGPSAGSFRRLR